MPGGFCGLYRNTRGARVAREHDMKRLERAIGIFRRMRKTYKDGTTVYMVMTTDDVAEILGWLEELKEYRAMGLDEFHEQRNIMESKCGKNNKF